MITYFPWDLKRSTVPKDCVHLKNTCYLYQLNIAAYLIVLLQVFISSVGILSAPVSCSPRLGLDVCHRRTPGAQSASLQPPNCLDFLLIDNIVLFYGRGSPSTTLSSSLSAFHLRLTDSSADRSSPCARPGALGLQNPQPDLLLINRGSASSQRPSKNPVNFFPFLFFLGLAHCVAHWVTGSWHQVASVFIPHRQHVNRATS